MHCTKNLKLLALILALFACGKEEDKTPEAVAPETPPAVEETASVNIRPVGYDELTNWKKDDLKAAMHAFALSCQKIMVSDKEYLSDSLIKIPTASYKEICEKMNKGLSPLEYKKFIEENFTPYLVIYNNSDIGQFTSYYEASIHASRNKSEVYRYPVYGRPYDMFEANLKDFDENLPNVKISGRVVGQKIVPYYSRKEINNMIMKAPAILWANSAVDLFIMQIQGSAVAFLDDGTQVRVGYDSSNGRKFTGVGKILLDRRLIRKDKATMMDIKQWLLDNDADGKEIMNENERYIFHRLNYEEGPVGALGVPLTAGRSLAVDPDYIPLGSLLWLETVLPKYGNVEKMMVAQDTGSAIKGPIRGDYFWGTGADDVLDLAGKMNATGRYYIFIPKNLEVNG